LPSISFVNVSKSFDKVRALDRVSFDVENGEYLCVLGPTGSGKTTLLRLIAGLLKPNSGTIYLGGKAVNDLEAHQRNAVYIPQQYALFPHLTVLENVAFAPLARGRPKQEALDIARKTLHIVRLASRVDAYPAELSGGMQQRVALARGLASGAGLLLLDEPLGALDARLRLDLRHTIKDLVKKSGFTAVHVTHDRDEAMSVADRIMVLREGRIQDLGIPRRVYNLPAGIFVANLIGGANFVEGIVARSDTTGSTVRIRGEITLQTSQTTLVENEPVVMAVRKEKVQFAHQRQGLDNELNGIIRETRFLGNSREYLIRLTNGDIFVSRRFSERREPAFRIGDLVYVGFRREDVMLFSYPPQGLRKELEAT